MPTIRILTPLVASLTLLASTPAVAQDAPRQPPAGVAPAARPAAPPSAPATDDRAAADPVPGEEAAPDEPASDDPAADGPAADEPAVDEEVATDAAELPAQDAPEVAPPTPERVRVVKTTKVVKGPPPGACSPAQVAEALEQAEAAIVHVEAPGAMGIGVVFHSRRHVLTTLSIVDAGRGVRVHVGGGRGRDARVVAFDRDHDLALLELDSAVSAPPLRLTSEDVTVGTPVLSVAVPADQWAEWGKWMRGNRNGMRVGDKRGPLGKPVAQPGQLTSLRGGTYRTNAIDGRHVTWGGPLLTCEGRLAGVAINPFTDEVTGPEPVRTLTSDVGDFSEYEGRWSGFHPSFAIVGQMDHGRRPGVEDRDMWLGFSFGNALIGYDQWIFPARFGASFLVGPELDIPFAERRGYRLQGQVGVGYRAMLFGGRVPVYLTPQAGFTLMYERTETRQTLFQVDPGCDAGAGCAVLPTELRLRESRLRPLPTVGGSLQIGFADFQYQLQIDPDGFDRSIHQVSIGGQW